MTTTEGFGADSKDYLEMYMSPRSAACKRIDLLSQQLMEEEELLLRQGTGAERGVTSLQSRRKHTLFKQTAASHSIARLILQEDQQFSSSHKCLQQQQPIPCFQSSVPDERQTSIKDLKELSKDGGMVSCQSPPVKMKCFPKFQLHTWSWSTRGLGGFRVW